jgi:hypothetical protein
MAELQRLVQAGLLSADDIAEEVTQLKAEAKAWRARSAAAASAGAQPAPPVTAAALAAPPPGPAPRVGGLSPAAVTPAVQARSSQASSLSNSASGAHARSAAAARDRMLKAAKGGKPEAAPAGSKSILTFPCFAREVNVRGVLTAVISVALNFGRFRCAHSPACSFTTDFQNALTVQAGLQTCARRRSSWWRWVALRSGTACNVQHAYGESRRPHAQFLKNRSGAARQTLARFLTTGFLKGGPTLYASVGMTCHCKPMLVPHAEAPSCL